MSTNTAAHGFKGGPSFQPLYASERCSDVPETAEWSHRTTSPDASWTGWTDVLVDFRTPNARTPLPSVLPDPEREWESDAPGWALTGWSFKPDPHPVDVDGEPVVDWLVDAMSVVRFTAPDGFRFTVAVSNDKPGRKTQFAYGRMSFLFPTMRFVFAGVNDTSRKSLRKKNRGWVRPEIAEQAPDGSGTVLSLTNFPNASQTYSLPVLRAAVEDPAAWFGTPHWQGQTFDGPFRTITADRALFTWATAGNESFAPVEILTRAGMDAAEWATWQDAVHDPAVIGDMVWSEQDCIDWFAAFGGGSNRRAQALRLRGHGLEPEQAARWQSLIGHERVNAETKAAMDTFDARGWGPADVRTMNQALINAMHIDGIDAGWGPVTRWTGVPLSTVVDWSFLPCERALAYVEAGIRCSEAKSFEETGEPVDDATLAMMAGLRPVFVPPF